MISSQILAALKLVPETLVLSIVYLDSDLSQFSYIKGEIQAHFLHLNSRDTRGEIGDLQYASNIDSTSQVDRMADLWYQHNWSDKFKTLIGIHDISMEFNVTKTSWNFLNASFGTTADLAYAGTNGPSIYPLTALGFRAQYQLSDEVEVLAGFYDADPGGPETYRSFHSDIGAHEGYLAITEVAHRLEKQKIGLGAWTQTRNFERPDSPEETAKSYGFYTMAEKFLTDSLIVVGRAGWSSPVVNQIQSNLVAAVMYRGIFQKKRNLDEIGLGVTQVHLARQFRTSLAEGLAEEEGDVEALEDEEEVVEVGTKNPFGPKETSFELYYQFQLFNSLNLRPDIQYIQNPSGNREVRDAIAVGLRTLIII
jgi:porin